MNSLADTKPTALVSGTDERYFSQLEDMLDSLRGGGDDRLRQYALKILDLGMSEANRARLRELHANVEIRDPGWRINLPASHRALDHKKIYLAKPFIPNMFPGHPDYLWVDADIWFQHPDALDDLQTAGQAFGASFVFEAHPLRVEARLRHTGVFGKTVSYGFRPLSNLSRNIRIMFGQDMAVRFGMRPPLNSGVFYMKADCPIWVAWQKMTRTARLKRYHHTRQFCDQTCLHAAILCHNLPHAIMPATHNFLPLRVTPLVDASAGDLLDPVWPNRPVKTVHLVDRKRTGFRLPLSDGSGHIETDLDYHSYLALRARFPKVSDRATVTVGSHEPDV